MLAFKRKFLATGFIVLSLALSVKLIANPSEPTEPRSFDSETTYMAEIVTEKGTIICELDTTKAPMSATNFMQLAESGFYNGLTFHRVVPGFVAQGGDPQGTGMGGPGYTIPAEIGLPHTQGALAWARLPDQVNPEKRSSGSQFYITLAPTPFLDGEYSVFGYVVEGQDVVENIAVGDTIDHIAIVTER